jgi:hypothetical protein
LDVAAKADLVVVKSPKSVASPVVAITTESITFTNEPVVPPPLTAVVRLDVAVTSLVAAVRLPKSAALPVEAIVM